MAEIKKRSAPARKPAQSRPKKPAREAKKPSNDKPGARKKPWGAIFWTAFFVVIAGLFFYNRDAIRMTLQNQALEQSRIASDSTGIIETVQPETPVYGNEIRLTSEIPVPPQADLPQTEQSPSAASAPVTADAGQQPAVTQSPVPVSETSAVIIENPAVSTPASQVSAATEQRTPSAQQVLRDRTMYFINVDRDGSILRSRVNRSLPVTDSPLTDTLSALLAGPTSEERQKGLISLIPEGTHLLNAIVRGNTAYINFNEDFQFNVYGVEGYAGSVRQVVWTATEFSNVRDVQFLIEGRVVNYLGEGIFIGSPVNRDMF